MDVGDFLRVDLEFTLPNSSNPAIMVWDFECTQSTGTWDLTTEGEQILDEIIATRYAPLAGFISNQVAMVGADIRAWAHPGDGYTTSEALWIGTATEFMLPPFITYSLELGRGNFLMRNGRKAYPGAIVTAVSASGLVGTTVRDGFQDTTDAWVDLFIEGTVDFTLSPRIVRVPTTPGVNPTVYSYIANYGTVKFGTQNTRKA